MTVSTGGLFASAGLARAICPPVAKWPSGLGPRSDMKPSKFEWAVLPLNSRSAIRRGQVALLTSVPSNAPVGCIGNANQKPVDSDPAATLSRKILSGLVIQKVDAVLSEGIRMSLAFWPSVLKFLPPATLNGPRFVGTQGLPSG